MKRGTDVFNDSLKEFPYYRDRPQMLPFVGKHWGKHKKLLIIGESHYLSPGGEEYSRDWYDLPVACLEADDIEWTNTAKIVDETDYKSRGHSVYRNIDYAIRAAGFKPDDSVFCYVAYMNFFQRPAEETGKSIKATDEDKDVANETLKYVCGIIKPDFLFFITRMARYSLYDDVFPVDKVGCSAHPASSWWNRANSEDGWKTGKQNFIDFIHKNGIFK